MQTNGSCIRLVVLSMVHSCKKGNSDHNLRTHSVTEGHLNVVAARENNVELALRSGKRGRPKKPDERDQNHSHNLIFKFFKENVCNSSTSSQTSSGNERILICRTSFLLTSLGTCLE